MLDFKGLSKGQGMGSWMGKRLKVLSPEAPLGRNNQHRAPALLVPTHPPAESSKTLGVPCRCRRLKPPPPPPPSWGGEARA